MAISKESMQFFQQTLEVTRKQIADLNTQIEEELARVKERLAELQTLEERRQADLRRRLPHPRASRTIWRRKRTGLRVGARALAGDSRAARPRPRAARAPDAPCGRGVGSLVGALSSVAVGDRGSA